MERSSRAEREGFEPSRGLLAPYSLSRRVPSAARPPLRGRVARATASTIAGWISKCSRPTRSRRRPRNRLTRGPRIRPRPRRRLRPRPAEHERPRRRRRDPAARGGNRHPNAAPPAHGHRGARALRGDLRRYPGAVRVPRPRCGLGQRGRHASPLPGEADPDREQVHPIAAGARAPAGPGPWVPGSAHVHPAGDELALGARSPRPGRRLSDCRSGVPHRLARITSEDPEEAPVVMVDSVEHLDLIEEAATSFVAPIRVAIDIDLSWWPLGGLLKLGVKRSLDQNRGAGGRPRP